MNPIKNMSTLSSSELKEIALKGEGVKLRQSAVEKISDQDFLFRIADVPDIDRKLRFIGYLLFGFGLIPVLAFIYFTRSFTNIYVNDTAVHLFQRYFIFLLNSFWINGVFLILRAYRFRFLPALYISSAGYGSFLFVYFLIKQGVPFHITGKETYFVIIALFLATGLIGIIFTKRLNDIDHPKVRLSAVGQLTDPALLKKIAVASKNVEDICVKALSKISSSTELIEIAKLSDDVDIGRMAASHPNIDDQESLTDLVRHFDNIGTKIGAIRNPNFKDQRELQHIIENILDYPVLKAAIHKIDSVAFLKEIAKTHREDLVRENAVQRLQLIEQNSGASGTEPSGEV